MSTEIYLCDRTDAHQAFSLMLHDRIIELENAMAKMAQENDAFKLQLQHYVAYEWIKFTFRFKLSGLTNECLARCQHTAMNAVMENRCETNPMFAYWCWAIGTVEDWNDMFEVAIYVRFGNPQRVMDHLRRLEQKKWNLAAPTPACPPIVTVTPMPSGVMDVKLLLENRLYFLNEFPESTESFGMNLWRKGGVFDEYELNKEWTHDEFMKSSNYKNVLFAHQDLCSRLFLYIKSHHWTYLFQMEEFD